MLGFSFDKNSAFPHTLQLFEKKSKTKFRLANLKLG